MKISLLNKVAVLLIVFCLQISCKQNSKSAHLIEQAQNIVENSPDNALLLLDSIENPEALSKDIYMQYILTSTESRYLADKDITGDSLIFEAQEYFDNGNPRKAALAHFYAATVYHENKLVEKALESYLRAKSYAEKTNDYKLTGSISDNIAYVHFEQGIINNAIVSYKEALNNYRIVDTIPHFELQAINSIGRSFDEANILDSAYYYFDMGLKAAISNKNKKYEAIFKQNLGVVCMAKKEYNQAASYLSSAITETRRTQDSLKIYLNFSMLYNSKNQLDSAKYYAEILKYRLPEITNNFTLRDAYNSLSDYYKNTQDYKEVVYYGDLEKAVNNTIAENSSSAKLLIAEKKYNLSLKDKELSNLRIRVYWYISTGILLLLLVTSVSYLRIRKHKKEKDLLIAEKELSFEKSENYFFIQDMYDDIVNKWYSIKDKVSRVSSEMYGENFDLDIELKGLINLLTEKSNIRMIQRAKDFLIFKSPNGRQAIETMTDEDLLFMMLCYSRYTNSQIMAIMGLDVNTSNSFFDGKRSLIRTKLQKAGIADSVINEILRVAK